MRDLQSAQRLIVAADFTPPQNLEKGGTRCMWVRDSVLRLVETLQDTGVVIKLNTPLRACGFALGEEVRTAGVSLFADLKLTDIPNTLTAEGRLLAEMNPELLTVMCSTGVEGMRALKMELPDTEVLGVTVLTTLSDEESQAVFSCSAEKGVFRLANLAAEAQIDGLISSARELEALRIAGLGAALSFNTPAIRPEWHVVGNDDQNPKRAMTPTEAIDLGADRVVIGRPITQAESPRDAVLRTINEITNAVT